MPRRLPQRLDYTLLQACLQRPASKWHEQPTGCHAYNRVMIHGHPQTAIAIPGADAARPFERRTGISEDDLSLIESIDPFRPLSQDLVRTLLQEASVRRYPRHTVLFVQDDKATHFHIVFEGWIKLFRQSNDGHESVIGVAGRGDTFAEMAIVEEEPHTVTAIAIAEARVLAVPAAGFRRQLYARPEICLEMLGGFSRKIRQLVNQVERLMVRSSAERLAFFLIDLCPDGDGPATIQLPLDKAVIAGTLGMQPETLSRSLLALRKLGVETHGRTVVISDVGRLHQFSEGSEARIA